MEQIVVSACQRSVSIWRRVDELEDQVVAVELVVKVHASMQLKL